MAQLTTYDHFVDRVDELGFLPMSNILPGLPSLGAETPEDIWHTGLETDPWQWKDRAAVEKKLAYGCILGGHKGFISARMYPIFFVACHPKDTMPERWAAGLVNGTTWRLWQLFEARIQINTSQARILLGSSNKKSSTQVDSALIELQRDFYITVSGNERKVSADGHFYGWPSNVYTRLVDWIPKDWLATAPEWNMAEARDWITEIVIGMNKLLNRKAVARALHWEK
jgi:hypothetical protein